ncbi:hypothetical protein EJB05_12782 [Eragrostis curvula]|uniref:F-box/LRR-repeat protein 15/At3g58940/PEG3-like LRR domain-containing protein n=1 Tax=Eragrostis curvula TaxID=38414 RepID=A0A5J9VTZ9_9POAL|nr:hypothetical protein EJB05_12782 [Eragrostis curvula]
MEELRSGRRLVSQRPPRSDGHGDGIDRISGLPDDLLLGVLARLRCARAAAHTSLLSRRWRGLWRQLPELTFRKVAPDALLAALAQVARTELSLLDIDVHEGHRFSPSGVAALLRIAARLAPSELRLIVWGLSEDRETAVEVPRFHRTTSIKLCVWNLYLALPDYKQGSAFPVLERLSVEGCVVNVGALILQCPQLRVLEVCSCSGVGTLRVRSTTIENLDVQDVWLGGVDIVAPALKRFTLSSYSDCSFSLSFSAPIVKNLYWSCGFDPSFHGISELWSMSGMHVELKERVNLLCLDIDAQESKKDANLMQKIAQFPDFSAMKLYLATSGHAYGAMVFNLLGLCTAIKTLKIVMRQLQFRKPCPPFCPCDQPDNWRSEIISLDFLEEVEIEGFQGAVYEVDFFKHIFRCAPMLKVIIIRLSDEASRKGCKKIYHMFKACPSLKWYFYRNCGEQVSYA